MKCVGQIGIVIEIIGAGYIVLASFLAKKELKSIDPETVGGVGEMSVKTYKLINGQFKDEVIGFSILVVGLLMQFISGFGD